MSKVYIIVEGKTEQTFVREILAPYLAVKGIFCTAVLLGKRGMKGGNVTFTRAKNDIELFLKQRRDTYVTTFFDYYGIKEWPGKLSVPTSSSPHEKAKWCEDETDKELARTLSHVSRLSERYISFLMIHEFEALLFSDTDILARNLDVPPARIEEIITKCGEPEAINDLPDTAPSKRIIQITAKRYKKTTTGIIIAKEIGLEKMRSRCPHFDSWVSRLEGLSS